MDNITMLDCGSAIGVRLPPYIVYKGKNLMSNHTHGGPPGTRYSMYDSGGWRWQIFVIGLSRCSYWQPMSSYSVFDGLKSDESLGLFELVEEYSVSLYVFPPRTTHLLQPLDVGVFGPLKSAWTKVLNEYKLETQHPGWIGKYFLPS